MRPDAPPAREFVPFMGRHFRLDDAAAGGMNHPVEHRSADETADVAMLDAPRAPERPPDEAFFDRRIGPDEVEVPSIEVVREELGKKVDEHVEMLGGWCTMCNMWSAKLERSEFSKVVHKQLESLREDCQNGTRLVHGPSRTLRPRS